MAMPIWVTFSPLNCDARGLMLDLLPDFLAAYRMQPFYSMPIERQGDEIVYLDAEGRRADTLSQMLEAGQNRLGVDLSLFLPDVGRYVRFVVLDQTMPAILCLSIPSEILSVDNDRYGKSGWVVNFIAKLANRLDLACSLSARDDKFMLRHEALDPDAFVKQLKSGKLLASVPPVILVVRDDLVTVNELSAVINAQPGPRFNLEHDGACHVLWSV